MKQYLIKTIFDTIQGEGTRAGTRAVFVRFGACNMWTGMPEDRSKGVGACALWCDTDFRSCSKRMSALEIADECFKLWNEPGEKWVVLSGGEPMLQVDEALLFELQDCGFKIAVETNGTVAVPHKLAIHLDWLCVSPKLLADGSMPDLQLKRGDELKVVLPGVVEGIGWTNDMLHELEKLGDWKNMLVQPLDPTDQRIVEVSHLRGGYSRSRELGSAVSQCINWVRENSKWRIGLQLHKVLNLE